MLNVNSLPLVIGINMHAKGTRKESDKNSNES